MKLRLTLKHMDKFHAFIKERHAIYTRRAAGQHPPWTEDTILQSYRFCNVFRELDTVTAWIKENWRDPNANDQDLFFAMAVARLFNRVSTLGVIRYPVPWLPDKVAKKVLAHRDKGNTIFTGAYTVSTNGVSIDKVQYIVHQVLTPLWHNRKALRPTTGDTLARFAARLTEQRGLKGFMAGQVVCDLKYAAGSPLSHAEDWHTFAMSGPGSRRGLNRVVGRDYLAHWRESVWNDTLQRLLKHTTGLLNEEPPMHAQDLQNCLCEFDKYERVRLGEGRPRSRFKPLNKE